MLANSHPDCDLVLYLFDQISQMNADSMGKNSEAISMTLDHFDELSIPKSIAYNLAMKIFQEYRRALMIEKSFPIAHDLLKFLHKLIEQISCDHLMENFSDIIREFLITIEPSQNSKRFNEKNFYDLVHSSLTKCLKAKKISPKVLEDFITKTISSEKFWLLPLLSDVLLRNGSEDEQINKFMDQINAYIKGIISNLSHHEMYPASFRILTYGIVRLQICRMNLMSSKPLSYSKKDLINLSNYKISNENFDVILQLIMVHIPIIGNSANIIPLINNAIREISHTVFLRAFRNFSQFYILQCTCEMESTNDSSYCITSLYYSLWSWVIGEIKTSQTELAYEERAKLLNLFLIITSSIVCAYYGLKNSPNSECPFLFRVQEVFQDKYNSQSIQYDRHEEVDKALEVFFPVFEDIYQFIFKEKHEINIILELVYDLQSTLSCMVVHLQWTDFTSIDQFENLVKIITRPVYSSELRTSHGIPETLETLLFLNIDKFLGNLFDNLTKDGKVDSALVNWLSCIQDGNILPFSYNGSLTSLQQILQQSSSTKQKLDTSFTAQTMNAINPMNFSQNQITCLLKIYGLFGEKFSLIRRYQQSGKLMRKDSEVNSSVEKALTQNVCNIISILFENQQSFIIKSNAQLHIDKIRSLSRLSNVHFFMLFAEAVALRLLKFIDQPYSALVKRLSMVFSAEEDEIFEYMTEPICTALVFRITQESHLRIKKILAEIPFLDNVSDYSMRFAKLKILPKIIVQAFLHSQQTQQQEALIKFIESHFNLTIDRIVRLNDVTRLLHQFVIYLHHPYTESVCHGLNWLYERLIKANRSQSSKESYKLQRMDSFCSSQLPDNKLLLDEQLCGLLAFFDITLLNDQLPLTMRHKALLSLRQLFSLLDENSILKMRAKFLTTLKICLRYQSQECSNIVVDLWSFFTKSLKGEALCELIIDVTANLVHLFDANPVRISDTINTLLRTQKTNLKQIIREFFFIPNHNSKLEMTNSIIDEMVPWRHHLSDFDSDSPPDMSLIHDFLCTILKTISHASRSVRVLALNYPGIESLLTHASLIVFSQSNFDCERNESRYQIASDLSKILKTLISSLGRDSDSTMTRLIAKWIGAIGPVDPSRLFSIKFSEQDATVNLDKTQNQLCAEFNISIICQRKMLILELFEELRKVYLRAASPTQLSKAAHSIQEMLVFAKISETDARSTDRGQLTRTRSLTSSDSSDSNKTKDFLSGTELWNRFDQQTRDLFFPLINSRYSIDEYPDWSKYNTPFILADGTNSFNDWIRPFCGFIASYISDENVRKVFQIVELVVLKDAEFARFVLEKAVVQVILDNNGSDVFLDEVLTVFKLVATSDNRSTSQNTMQTPNVLKSSNNPNNNSMNWKPFWSLAAQTIFSLLDALSHWMKTAKKKVATAQQRQNQISESDKKIYLVNFIRTMNTYIKNVEAFFAKIPSQLQAKAAYRCGNFTRSLINWEQYFQAQECIKDAVKVTGMAIENEFNKNQITKQPSNDKNVHLNIEAKKALKGMLFTLQKLHDKDGLTGCIHIFQFPSVNNFQDDTEIESNTMNKLITLELENSRQFDLAIANYELQLEQLQDDENIYKRINLLDGLFRCQMVDPGKLPSLVSTSSEIIRKFEQSNKKANLSDYCCLYRSSIISNHLSNTESKSNSVQKILSHKAEACWRLGNWGLLKETQNSTLNTPNASMDWNLKWGQALLNMKEKKWARFENLRHEMRENSIEVLNEASIEGWSNGYKRTYSSVILQLSLINEISLFSNMIKEVVENPYENNTKKYETVMNVLDGRLKLCQSTINVSEPLLAARHSFFTLSSQMLKEVREDNRCGHLSKIEQCINQKIGQYWLLRANIARSAKQFVSAYSCVLRAEEYGIYSGLILRAKLLHDENKIEEALKCLDIGIHKQTKMETLIRPESNDGFLAPMRITESNLNFDNLQNTTDKHNSLCETIYEAKLLRAIYSEEISRYDFDKLCDLYGEVKKTCNWRFKEESHFRLARFVDKTRSKIDLVDKQANKMLKVALTEYGECLCYGSQFHSESMPRLLSLWLDHGSEAMQRSYLYQLYQKSRRSGECSVSVDTLNEDKKTLDQVLTLIKKIIDRVPAYQFYASLSQIISRLCHEHAPIACLLIELVVKITVYCPGQSLWQLMSQYGSSVKPRKDKCDQIFIKIKKMNAEIGKFADDYIALCQYLKLVSNYGLEDREIKSFSLSTTFKALVKFIENIQGSKKCSSILIPIHNQLNAKLPNPSQIRLDQVDSNFNNDSLFKYMIKYESFPTAPSGSPGAPLKLYKFQDHISVLGSQTRPKKMTWIADNGRSYIIVAKPKDDCRKDCRLMELNTIINQFLIEDPETNHRDLFIRTYAVVPLSEKGGLIEWVDKTEPFRIILTRILSEMGSPVDWAKMSRVSPLLNDSLELKRRKYLTEWLPMFPLVFYRWFLNEFPDPSFWYNARECYRRSSAVMSMVGYVLGLGDRHTENILMDSSSGYLVHVDFSCVFNTGLTLLWPERVPFRLTRNMTHAMGALGHHGTFRVCCEVTMAMLRRKVDPISAVFKPIYYDALVEEGGLNFASKAAREQSLDASLKLKKSSKTSDSSDPLCPEKIANVTRAASEKLNNIERRLLGYITEHDDVNQHMTMSVKGQVEELIYEATDVDRLCQMYKGWMPFF